MFTDSVSCPCCPVSALLKKVENHSEQVACLHTSSPLFLNQPLHFGEHMKHQVEKGRRWHRLHIIDEIRKCDYAAEGFCNLVKYYKTLEPFFSDCINFFLMEQFRFHYPLVSFIIVCFNGPFLVLLFYYIFPNSSCAPWITGMFFKKICKILLSMD